MEESGIEIYLKDLLISHLTSSHFIQDETERRNISAECGFCPETDRFAVVVVQIERWSSVLASPAEQHEATKHHFFLLHNMLHELIGRENLSVEAEKDYQMVCLVAPGRPWQEFRDSLSRSLREMMEVLETEFDVSVTIAVSREVEGFNALPEAYLQAREALWYNAFLEQDMQILFYEDLHGNYRSSIRQDLMTLDRKLIARIQAADSEAVKYVLHEMIDLEFIRSQPPVELLRTRLGGICCKILDAVEELQTMKADPICDRRLAFLPVMEAGSLSELTGSMDELLDELGRRKSAEKQEPKPNWVDRMELYIQEHYADENLGLTEVSEVFGITPSYATRVFRQYTGKGIYETIQHVRLEAAKSLMDTGLTMKQIAGKVGYTSFLSMNRAFKKYEGTTPSRFREQ